MASAVDKLSMFKVKNSKSAPPTADHLAPEDGSPPEQPPPSESVNGALKAGGFEKLSAMFGGAGPVFQIPNSGTAK